MKISISIAMAVTLLAGCTPQSLETAPVAVDTPQGQVMCQLYLKEIVQWDRAISHPGSMELEAANAVCVAEGKRRQKG
ncbi:hypothetical protein [Paracoccus marinaquae]|uniref:Lipoprotein n=1 Tax=Paracoccus marinaquae TaxID=2841926 RepID=A0ABS6ADG0_9RHOB|nr:hypothetical protein [Paracoccus marinaquae]MBU3028637.1 hypothetical protein [Paracoccus marinaquae]